jgi:hypothetical protein
MSKDRRDNMRQTSRMECFTHANVMPPWVRRQALFKNASGEVLADIADDAAKISQGSV